MHLSDFENLSESQSYNIVHFCFSLRQAQVERLDQQKEAQKGSCLMDKGLSLTMGG